MKKTLYTLFFLITTISLLSWQWEKTQHPALDKGEVIECLNMETQQAYQLEASQSTFAKMHLAPIQVDPSNLLGKVVPFNAADGRPGQAYFIPAKKKSDKWLIVIQEWWGLNDNIKIEADTYYK
ncbi:MAG: hypothetical protein RIT38_504, partial [Bacteroidota bacterium]